MTSPTSNPIDQSLRNDAALIAAEATLRRNPDIAAVFVITPHRSATPTSDLTVLRVEPVDPTANATPMVFHVPQWAQTLLASTEGVR